MLERSYTMTEVDTATVSGRELGRKLKASAGQRAILAGEMRRGALLVHTFTCSQTASLTGVSLGYIGTAAHLSDADRQALALGQTSISLIHNYRPRRPIADADLDRLIAKIGAGRVLDALDRMTRPLPYAA